MSQPIVFIGTHEIREGKLEAFKEHFEKHVPVMQGEKPGTAVFYAYLNEDQTEVSIVHMFPDSKDMDAHMEGLGERAAKAFEFLQPRKLDIYGDPGESVMEMMRRSAAMGAELAVHPDPIAGYTRL